jgi:hypothetical protein
MGASSTPDIARQRNAEGEGAGVDALDRHAQRCRHVAVEGGGAHHGAQRSAEHHQPHRAIRAPPNSDQEEPVVREE